MASSKSKNIAKNTLILYVRMIFLMIVNLYTSRVVLHSLGETDYGIYDVVGGFVLAFSIVSKSLSSASSRFLNFEMGRGDNEKLKVVFCSVVSIQYFIAFIVLLLCETIGLWFLNTKMVIPTDRIVSANWVFQFSILTFCSNLITVPYNAAIIAHEKMKAFAYVSIFEGVGKLVIAFAICYSPVDILIYYAALICLLQFIVRYIYRHYSKTHFEECTYNFSFDKGVLKEILGFSSWNFIGGAGAILRTHGGNILINIFFGPSVNAARAIANQVMHAVNGFVTNFMMAMKPQITQSYARGDYQYMMSLVYKGSKLSFFLLLFLCLPILVNTDYVLHLWLKKVPEFSSIFVQLILVFSLSETLSNTLIAAQLSTGNIRNYQIVVGGLQLLNIPISYVWYVLGGAEYSFIIVAILLSVICLIARLIMLKSMIQLSILDYFQKVILKALLVSACSIVIPILLYSFYNGTFLSFIINVLFCFLSSALSIYFVGCDEEERSMVKKIKNKFLKK